MNSRILAIGDSHVSFWGGKNAFTPSKSAFTGMDLLYVGAATAHNLSNEPPNHAGWLIRNYLSEFHTNYACVMFCFGEIDCRAHILRIAIKNSISIDQAVEATADRYFSFIQEIAAQYSVASLIWGPVPSSPPANFAFNPEFPAVGSILERNYATALLNTKLADRCSATANVRHLSIFDELTDADGVTKAEYFYDGCHLANIALSIAATKVRGALVNLGLDHLVPAMRRAWPISVTPHLRNVAAGQIFSTSSQWRIWPQRRFGLEPNGQLQFHTDIEGEPWLLLELDAAYILDSIIVHNRSDACEDRARSLAISVSNDKTNFLNVYCPKEFQPFGAKDAALEVAVDLNDPIRFVRLYLREKNYFHLDCVQVYAKSFLQEGCLPY